MQVTRCRRSTLTHFLIPENSRTPILVQNKYGPITNAHGRSERQRTIPPVRSYVHICVFCVLWGIPFGCGLLRARSFVAGCPPIRFLLYGRYRMVAYIRFACPPCACASVCAYHCPCVRRTLPCGVDARTNVRVHPYCCCCWPCLRHSDGMHTSLRDMLCIR